MAVILNAGMSETKPHAQLTLQPLGRADQSPEDFLKDCIPSLSLSHHLSSIYPSFLQSWPKQKERFIMTKEYKVKHVLIPR